MTANSTQRMKSVMRTVRHWRRAVAFSGTQSEHWRSRDWPNWLYYKLCLSSWCTEPTLLPCSANWTGDWTPPPQVDPMSPMEAPQTLAVTGNLRPALEEPGRNLNFILLLSFFLFFFHYYYYYLLNKATSDKWHLRTCFHRPQTGGNGWSSDCRTL